MIINGEGRFVLLEKPAAYPFTDVVTTTGEGPVFDLSVDLEFYNGVVYVKAEHIEEMARTLGMEYKKEAEPISAEINHDLESIINGIDSVLSAYRPLSNSSISVPVYLQDIDPGTESGEGTGGEPDSDDSGESVTGESDNPAGKDSNAPVGKGPAKLSSSTGNEFNF